MIKTVGIPSSSKLSRYKRSDNFRYDGAMTSCDWPFTLIRDLCAVWYCCVQSVVTLQRYSGDLFAVLVYYSLVWEEKKPKREKKAKTEICLRLTRKWTCRLVSGQSRKSSSFAINPGWAYGYCFFLCTNSKWRWKLYNVDNPHVDMSTFIFVRLTPKMVNRSLRGKKEKYPYRTMKQLLIAESFRLPNS